MRPHTLRAFARTGWGHYVLNETAGTASFVGLPQAGTFAVTGARGPRDVAIVAAGVEAQISDRMTVGTRVDAEMGQRSTAVAGTARVRWSL